MKMKKGVRLRMTEKMKLKMTENENENDEGDENKIRRAQIIEHDQRRRRRKNGCKSTDLSSTTADE